MTKTDYLRATLKGPLAPPPATVETVEGFLHLGEAKRVTYRYPDDEPPLFCPPPGPWEYKPARFKLERVERYYRSYHVAYVEKLHFIDASERTRIVLEEVMVIGWSGQGGRPQGYRPLLPLFARLLAANYGLSLEEPREAERFGELEELYSEPPV